MSDRHYGVYRKYNVERADGSSAPGGKHHDCNYFVLDLMHDQFAIPALHAYADACESTHPQLAHDLRFIADGGTGDTPFSANTRFHLKVEP